MQICWIMRPQQWQVEAIIVLTGLSPEEIDKIK